MYCKQNHKADCDCCMACQGERKAMYRCAWCKEVIYEGEDYYEIDGKGGTIGCEDCISGFQRTAGVES